MKALAATCTGQVVTIGALPPKINPLPGLPDPGSPPLVMPLVLVQSMGIGPSTGVVIMDEGNAYYFTNIAPDLLTTLQQVSAALTQVASALQSLDTAGFLIAADAGVPSPPIVAANITALNTAKAALDTLAGALK